MIVKAKIRSDIADGLYKTPILDDCYNGAILFLLKPGDEIEYDDEAPQGYIMNERSYKTIIAVLISIIISVICICWIYFYPSESTNTKTEEPDDMLIEIESHFSYAIMYDKDTKVMYFRGMSSEADLCPLYNADGSLKLYSEGE